MIMGANRCIVGFKRQTSAFQAHTEMHPREIYCNSFSNKSLQDARLQIGFLGVKVKFQVMSDNRKSVEQVVSPASSPVSPIAHLLSFPRHQLYKQISAT